MEKIGHFGLKLRKSLTAFCLLMIRLYQAVLSPLMSPRCRFYPSCSNYAKEAIQVWGPVKGLGLTIWRLLRCHPGSAGGYDPVRGSHRDSRDI